MKVDKENKIVYLEKSLFTELTTLKNGIGVFNIVSLFQILWEHQKDYPEIAKFLWSYENDIWINGEEPFAEDDRDNQVLMVKIWSNEYELKLIEQKYYWRKKKEYQTKFEQEHSYGYLVKGVSVPYIINGYGSDFTYTETEARDLLKDDFDKFEKVSD